MELNINLKQTTSLSPQMLHSMKILQMGTQELLEYIEELSQENPTIEVEENYSRQDEFIQMKKKLEWLEASDTQNIYYYKADKDDGPDQTFTAYELQDIEDGNLYLYIKSQLCTLEIDEDTAKAVGYIIESLDGRGYLEEDDDTLAAATGLSKDLIARAVELVQSLEPTGVGARSLKECLRLQLKRRRCGDKIAFSIVDGYLDALGKGRYGLISRELGAQPDKVYEACDLIRSLNPHPGTGFSARENLLYINPDVFIIKFRDHFEVLTNDYFFPTIKISRYYQGLFRKTDEKEVKEYLGGKIKQARWVVKSIEQRKTTMLRCVECILEIQEKFFRSGPGNLVPMSLADISRRLDVHESTVSRALKDKYVQCSSGVYPMSYFFSRAVGDENKERAHSPDEIKMIIKEYIATEDKKKPLSDNRIAERLLKKGANVSRRTIAKYRMEMGIASTVSRRDHER